MLRLLAARAMTVFPFQARQAVRLLNILQATATILFTALIQMTRCKLPAQNIQPLQAEMI